MYKGCIYLSKIEIQTNTHIPITPSPHRKHSSLPTYTKHDKVMTSTILAEQKSLKIQEKTHLLR